MIHDATITATRAKIKRQNWIIVCCAAPELAKLLSAEHSRRHHYGIHAGVYAVFMSILSQSIAN
jgi:hypothetical protein